jgi:predicted AAA+ superfamily ATPase
LGIKSSEQIISHYARGALFENFIVIECLKMSCNQGKVANVYFWRDKLGHEIDILLDNNSELIPIEIKSGSTLNSDYFKNIKYWHKISEVESQSFLIYSGEKQQRKKTTILNWQNLDKLLISV